MTALLTFRRIKDSDPLRYEAADLRFRFTILREQGWMLTVRSRANGRVPEGLP